MALKKPKCEGKNVYGINAINLNMKHDIKHNLYTLLYAFCLRFKKYLVYEMFESKHIAYN